MALRWRSANVGFGSWSCQNALRHRAVATSARWRCEGFRLGLCLHRRHERLDAHDVNDAGEIVGQYVKSHLRGDPR
jgi:hypothetical protein